MNTSQVIKNIRLLSLVLFLTPFFSGCEALDELDRETRERNLRNLKDWNVNSSTSEEAISEFGYENCFKIVAVEDYWWNEFSSYYRGDQSAVKRNDYSSVRTLFYCKNAMDHIHVGEIICNKSIANDLLTIFRQLYEAKYDIDTLMPTLATDYIILTEDASPSYNHTFCFHFMADPVDEMHLKGLALVVNPYAPSQPTADDLCVKLFKQHGFTWGGDVQGGKRYRFESSRR